MGSVVRLVSKNPDTELLLRARTTFDASATLAAISTPTLVLQHRGMQDDSEALRILATMPDARLVDLKNTGDSNMIGPIVEFVLGTAEDESQTAAGSGFRTILFTDVVGSTPLLATLKDERMRAVMRDHDAVVEAPVMGHRGRVVKSLGDGVMAEFALPSAAVEAAIAMQRGIREQFASSDVPLRLRIGINAGNRS